MIANATLKGLLLQWTHEAKESLRDSFIVNIKKILKHFNYPKKILNASPFAKIKNPEGIYYQ
jgi:hypothetical protein